MRALPILLILAGATWLGSELLEVALGGRSTLSLWLTALFHLLMVPGIWGAVLGQREPRPAGTRPVAAGIALGYLVMVYPPIAVAGSSAWTIASFLREYLVFQAAGLLAMLGTALFGWLVLRARSYPAWVGGVLLVTPLIFTVALALDGPPGVVAATNTLHAAALMAMGWIATQRG